MGCTKMSWPKIRNPAFANWDIVWDVFVWLIWFRGEEGEFRQFHANWKIELKDSQMLRGKLVRGK